MEKIPLTITGFEGQDIVVVPASLWQGPQLLVQGQPARKGTKRGTLVLRRNDGREVEATWKATFLGLDVPALLVDGKPVPLVEPLPWYQIAWCAIPILLLLVGGALGAMIGMVTTAINLKIVRANSSPFYQWALTLVATIGAYLVFMIVRGMILSVLPTP
jgi:hypothetical protein